MNIEVNAIAIVQRRSLSKRASPLLRDPAIVSRRSAKRTVLYSLRTIIGGYRGFRGKLGYNPLHSSVDKS